MFGAAGASYREAGSLLPNIQMPEYDYHIHGLRLRLATDSPVMEAAARLLLRRCLDQKWFRSGA